MIVLDVEDVDALFRQAVAAGAIGRLQKRLAYKSSMSNPAPSSRGQISSGIGWRASSSVCATRSAWLIPNMAF